MAVPGSGSALQRGRRIGRGEGRVRNKHPVVAQTVAAAIGTIPDRDGTDRGPSAQIHLPPGVGFRIGDGHRAVKIVPVGVPIDGIGRPGDGAIGAALRGRLAEGQIEIARHLHLGQAQVVRVRKLNADITALGAARRNRCRRIGGHGLVTAPGPSPALQGGRRIGGAEGRVRNEHPVVAQTAAATIGTIPDRNGADGGGSAQVHLPPRVGVQIGVGNRAVKIVPIGVPIDGIGRPGDGAIGAALRGRLAQREVRQ